MKLEGVILFLFAGSSILCACVAVALSPVFLATLAHLERMRRKPTNVHSAFLKKILRGLPRRTFRDLNDVHNAYRALLGIGTLRASHLEDIGRFLQRAKQQMSSAPKGSGDSADEKTLLLDELIAANQRALEVERQCVPFSGTPEPEQQLLEDLLQLTQGGEKPVHAKLDALARAIRERQDALERLGRESNRSLSLAKWGWYGTLGFSILSIILGILALER